MRKLPLLLVLLLLSLMLLAAAASAHAADPPPLGDPFPPAAAAGDEESDESEAEAGEDEEAEIEEGEACGAEEEGEELCEEEDESEEAEQCPVEAASAAVVVGARSDQVRLTVRYHSSEPATVAIDTSLRGAKGGLHLGSEHARFGRAGAFHGSFRLDRKQMIRALAAREFEIDLHAVGTPADCELRLATRGSRRAK
ncbi:MAG TPA: hypothetical protein VFL77_01565 [Solirubrobacterales bacterium]|nr:hypothetical protein [Solirubrobacterales bacterium]